MARRNYHFYTDFYSNYGLYDVVVDSKAEKKKVD